MIQVGLVIEADALLGETNDLPVIVDADPRVAARVRVAERVHRSNEPEPVFLDSCIEQFLEVEVVSLSACPQGSVELRVEIRTHRRESKRSHSA